MVAEQRHLSFLLIGSMKGKFFFPSKGGTKWHDRCNSAPRRFGRECGDAVAVFWQLADISVVRADGVLHGVVFPFYNHLDLTPGSSFGNVIFKFLNLLLTNNVIEFAPPLLEGR